MDNPQLVMEQYGVDSLLQRVEKALIRAGLGEGTLKWADLVPLDQFHVRGLAATRELAEGLRIEPGSELLDVGCGLGGPARFLAATYDGHVTGIDLSQPFIDVAVMLTGRCGMANRMTFQQADALDLPFDEARFDAVWTQHVAMNIADRRKFYAEIYRVLKPGGRLAIYDIVAGDGRPLIFPVPWARRAELSFLVTVDAMQQSLQQTGFVDVLCSDKTADSLTWFAELKTRLQSSPPLSLQVVMGPEFLQMAQNLGKNLQEGRVRIVQAIAVRA